MIARTDTNRYCIQQHFAGYSNCGTPRRALSVYYITGNRIMLLAVKHYAYIDETQVLSKLLIDNGLVSACDVSGDMLSRDYLYNYVDKLPTTIHTRAKDLPEEMDIIEHPYTLEEE